MLMLISAYSKLPSQKKIYSCYYLLYKLKEQPIFWIVGIDNNKQDLIKHIKGYSSTQDNYYIIKRYIENTKPDLNFKNFTRFYQQITDHVIIQTD
jgi:hypothetical protein